MSGIVETMRQEIISRSDSFEEKTKGTKEEYNLYREHVRIVHQYVMLLSEGSGADREVLELSALLHDISMTDGSLDRSKHNEYSASIAEGLLRLQSCPEEKIQLVKKCVLNHSSKRAGYRTTKEEQILVDADGLSHFDMIHSIYSLAHNVMELNDADALLFIQDKLTRDYLEISEGLKYLIQDKYDRVMRAETIDDLGI
ncbi:MAG: HD domain-containing protein [Clostridia bacterium]|nr:HD domain-containing protein [Clostridia bacterium]